MDRKLTQACVAEFIGTFALIFIGVGAIAACGRRGDLVGIALAHGLTIAVMVSATGGISGGHLNPAVSFGLCVGGQISPRRMAAYWVSQLAGASAAGFLMMALSAGHPIVANGTPDLTEGVSWKLGAAFEAVTTFFLVFVVYGSAVDSRAPKIGGLAIGATIALDILCIGQWTGGSMNPARTFGPALASGHWNNHYVYWLGPLLGGAGAGVIYGRFLIKQEN
jgi:MIP family channel proteins